MALDHIELVSLDRFASGEITLRVKNCGRRTLGPGLLRVVLGGLKGAQRVSPPNGWPIEPAEVVQLIAHYATMSSSDHGFHIAKVDVVDYLEFGGTAVPCGAVVEFQGWRQTPVIRHQAH